MIKDLKIGRDFLKIGRAIGVDEPNADLWEEAGEKVHDKLFKVIKDIYNSGNLPLDFVKCLIIPIPKKPTATKCEHYRTISLLSRVSNILTSIMARRIEGKIEAILSKDQIVFRKNMGTWKTILTCKVVCKERIRKSKSTFIAFVDLDS